MPAKRRSPRFRMPKVYRPNNENVFRCKVGYYITASGKRERKEFRLGDDEMVAYKTALKHAEAWLMEKQRHRETKVKFSDVFPDQSSLPIWTGMAEKEERFREVYLSTPPDDLPGDEIAVSTYSIQQAIKDVLARILEKATQDRRAFGTYRWYEREFRLGMIPKAIDPRMPVNQIGLTDVERYCNFWCDLSLRAAESKRQKFGWRSAWNRLDAFAFLLRDLEGRVEGYTYPARADATFEDAKSTVAGPRRAIFKYDPSLIRAILAQADDGLRLYIYCALNCGMLQCDIGQQIRRRHSVDKGGLIEINGEIHLQWYRYKLRRRQRDQMRVKEEERPVLLTHYIWPEVLNLLTRCAADENNDLNLWFLNSNGLPLWRQYEHHQRAVDNISTDYYRAAKKANVKIPFDQFRKFGGTAMESLATREVQELYRGERRQGSSRAYVLGDFTGKLTPILKKWATQLRADGVLFDQNIQEGKAR